MDDTESCDDLPPLNTDQIRDLAEAICGIFGGGLSRTEFTDKLLIFLEDVPGYESGEVTTALLESAWAEYRNRLKLG